MSGTFYKEITELTDIREGVRVDIARAAQQGKRVALTAMNTAALEWIEKEGFKCTQVGPIGEEGCFNVEVRW